MRLIALILPVMSCLFMYKNRMEQGSPSKECYGNVFSSDSVWTWIGKEFPILQDTTIGGEVINFKRLNKKIYCFNFWSIECGPCRIELDDLNKFFKLKDSTIAFYSFCDNEKGDIIKFMNTTQIDFPIVSMQDSGLDTTLVEALPTTVICDSNLRIRKILTGVVVDKKKGKVIVKAKERLLKEIDTIY